ncbi:uncharacterized protein LOC103187665 [Callorhinchus milii]|uniref:uncharacterized protein LOC103187665 n=1 Tax=Callorhinchus milii TaxID=7868 RepID=UPI001C3F9827|nr:uncharacterized protein LOC103187665 [Callorhinchus milii]
MNEDRESVRPDCTGENDVLLPNLRPRHCELIQTPCGPRKAWAELSVPVKIYFCFAIVSALVAFVLTIYSISLQELTDSPISIIQAIGIVFCCYYVVRGIFQENQQELGAFVASVLFVMIRSVVNFAVATPEERADFEIRFWFLIVVGFIDIVCALWLMCSLNMMAFRVSGAYEQSQSLYWMKNLCSSLVTFDLQGQLCLCVLFLTAGVNRISTVHYVILGVGIFWAFLKAAIGLRAILKEKKVLAWAFMILNVPELVYLCYLLYVVIDKWDCKGSCVLEAGTVTGTVISVGIKVGLFWSVVKFVRSFEHELRRVFTSAEGTNT